MPNACQNGGTCHNSYGSYQCVCVNGWTGNDCSENIDDCVSAACYQGSTCHDRVASFHCECPHGRTGIILQIIGKPLLKFAVLLSTPVHRLSHVKFPVIRWTKLHPVLLRPLLDCLLGLLCHLDNACINNPCQKGSNCDINPVTGNYSCICPPGYIGASCDQDFDECSLGKSCYI